MLYYHHENREGDFTLRWIAEIVGHVDGIERCFEGPFTISITLKLLVFRGYSKFNKKHVAYCVEFKKWSRPENWKEISKDHLLPGEMQFDWIQGRNPGSSDYMGLWQKPGQFPLIYV